MVTTPGKDSSFAIRFIKHLVFTDFATQHGSACYQLLTVIAAIEDEKRYRGPVAFFNAPLMAKIGVAKEETLAKARARCIELGMLSYKPGSRTRPGQYEIINTINGFGPFPASKIGQTGDLPEWTKDFEKDTTSETRQHPENGHRRGGNEGDGEGRQHPENGGCGDVLEPQRPRQHPENGHRRGGNEGDGEGRQHPENGGCGDVLEPQRPRQHPENGHRRGGTSNPCPSPNTKKAKIDEASTSARDASEANPAPKSDPPREAKKPRAQKPKKDPPEPRARNPLFDAIVEVHLGHGVELPDGLGSLIGKVTASLSKHGYTTADVREFGLRFLELCPYARREGRTRPEPVELEKHIAKIRAAPVRFPAPTSAQPISVIRKQLEKPLECATPKPANA